MNHPKSAVTAGLLGIFLGQFGAHNWYLGEKVKGIIHVLLFVGGIILMIAAIAIVISAVPEAAFYSYSRYSYSYEASVSGPAAIGFMICLWLAILLFIGNAIWALVEAIIIFARGDQGLAARGYLVANPNFHPSPQAQGSSNGSAPTNSNSMNMPQNPVQRPPKQPMNPKTKKKIIIGVIAGVVLLIAAIVAIVVISILSQVDYGESYRVAKELDEKMDDLYYDDDCSYAVDYVSSAWTSERKYNDYITSCKDTLDGVDELITKLGDTAGVKRNSEIKDEFTIFEENFKKDFPDLSDISSKLDLYQVWHTYIVKVDDLSTSSTDSEVKAAADVLIKSGNETLSAYATTWQEKTLARIHAYKAYWDSSYNDPNRDELRKAMNSTQTEQSTWVSENRPDIISLVGLEFNSLSKTYNSFGNLYKSIVEAYEENYDYSSGDCTYYEYSDTVYCR